MQKPLKILVVRFSSIGDIVLTSPVVRCLKNQLKAEVHYITNVRYSNIVNNNPNIDKVITISDSISQVLENLKLERYDVVIDLHKNIRSYSLTSKLNTRNLSYNKHTLKRLFYVYFGINLLPKKHTVDYYFSRLKKIGIKNDNAGLDFFIKDSDKIDYNISHKYIAWCIGASYENKKLSERQISYVSSRLNIPIVLLGDKNDKELGDRILEKTQNKNIVNFCGKLTINQSSYLLKNSYMVLSNDTGLMHISSAFGKNIISFWGCTKPNLGFYPLVVREKSKMITSNDRRPCSKHGKYCRISPDGCVKNIHPEIILEAVNSFID